jgi:hypothetical protein
LITLKKGRSRTKEKQLGTSPKPKAVVGLKRVVALRTCPEWLKGMDKDNFSWVAGVKVEVRNLRT